MSLEGVQNVEIVTAIENGQPRTIITANPRSQEAPAAVANALGRVGGGDDVGGGEASVGDDGRGGGAGGEGDRDTNRRGPTQSNMLTLPSVVDGDCGR